MAEPSSQNEHPREYVILRLAGHEFGMFHLWYIRWLNSVLKDSPTNLEKVYSTGYRSKPGQLSVRSATYPVLSTPVGLGQKLIDTLFGDHGGGNAALYFDDIRYEGPSLTIPEIPTEYDGSPVYELKKPYGYSADLIVPPEPRQGPDLAPKGFN